MITRFENKLKASVLRCFNEIYQQKLDPNSIQVQNTREDFNGDFTLVVFPLLKYSKASPEETAHTIGKYIKETTDEVSEYNVIKGFLNISISVTYWLSFLSSVLNDLNYGYKELTDSSKTYMIEYSSPNTNKPLHLGHIRNNLLGFSVSNILKADGNNVIKVNLVNDRGIHICKSMIAWKMYGNGETPESSKKKGDHLVGDYYVRYDQEYKAQVSDLIRKDFKEDDAKINAPILKDAQDMLRKWEAGDKDVIDLWNTMNRWVYEGFNLTYKRLGVDFDKIYYESETYILGKKMVEEGYKKGIFYKKDDGSVWVDLTNEGLDHKLLIRSDGTTVYMTQDIGTAIERVNDYKFDEMIYVVGNEQDYHFQVLAKILDKLGFSWAKNLTHLSYGMVELPSGKMKSREGTVVDADDLMDEMIETARSMSKELGKLDGYSDKEKENIVSIIGMGALKYYILKVDFKKNMVFNPEESIDFNGNTGPFIQYTFARIKSVMRKASDQNILMNEINQTDFSISNKELQIVKLIYAYPDVVSEAASSYSPAIIANYVYELAKNYNQFYHDYSILKEKNNDLRNFRILMSVITGKVIQSSLNLLGIEVPERM